jgi:hypothetical protein
LTRLLLLSLPEQIGQGGIDSPLVNMLQRGPLGVVIQYLPFSLTTSTPFIVALPFLVPTERT